VIQDPQETPDPMDGEDLEEKTEEMGEGDPMAQMDPQERKEDVAHVDPQDHLDLPLVERLDQLIL